ncbi:hypothetical protein [Streptomyces venezuelae]|uniref:Uncharacterized protein n=1 Tax=Streptomyces venezuelae (strain ATCC 10712 / CBS 650.69 / DSM 40230 / JCM 4526 / NBRC 13096 / PD 04745) TaxID=953739 RepID=F2RJF8_STRVP|nr:hypothetical protein vnz_09220 [Streptomyces venezuelae]CCA55168.1 hypothetical protein SVEN_1881 [Streptomyces venezuelae ATCC 10712]
MSTQDLVPSPVGPVDVEQAEAALVERYPRLVRIAYLVLPPSLGRNRRVLTAHALVQRSLPRRRVPGPAVPQPRAAEDAVDPGYAYVRGEVLRQALVAGLPLRRLALPRRAQFPPLLPHVWGLRLFPRVGGADELALDQRLSRLSGPGRAAYVLRGLERQGDPEVLRVLAAAGVEDPESALAEADAVDAVDAPETRRAPGTPTDHPERVGEQPGPGDRGPTPGPTGTGTATGPSALGAGAGAGRPGGHGTGGGAGRPADGTGSEGGEAEAGPGARGGGRTAAGPAAGGGPGRPGAGDPAGVGGGWPEAGPSAGGGGGRSGAGDPAGVGRGRPGAGPAAGGGAGRPGAGDPAGVGRGRPEAGPTAGGSAGRPGTGDPAGVGGSRAGVFDPGLRRSGVALLESDEFDPCALQARPTDLVRRRQHVRAVVVGVVALLVCGALLGLPGDGWGRNGAAAPSYARNPAAEAALDPAALKRVPPAVWPVSTRQDFSVWPARGGLTGDRALLRRALAVWARPGTSVHSSATPGTPVGPPMGPPQLLFAGVVDGARVVLLHDGLRAVRYAEPVEGTAGTALDFARTDGADTVGSAALVVSRAAGNVRYLTAPWVKETVVRDLLVPGKAPLPLPRDAAGVTEPMTSPALAQGCTRWNTLEVVDGSGRRLLTDLGELTPARLLWGPPAAPADATGAEARGAWARTACQLTAVRAHGVRSVNAWRFARQALPEGAGHGTWLCTRAETWRGTGSRVLAQFLVPSPAVPAALAARSEGSPACGVREPRVLAGVLWQAPGGGWYVLAAGSAGFTALEVSGGVKGRSDGPVLAVRAAAGARADLGGTLADGTRVGALR